MTIVATKIYFNDISYLWIQEKIGYKAVATGYTFFDYSTYTIVPRTLWDRSRIQVSYL